MSGHGSTKPTKFVEEPTALLCPVCKRVYRDPVISIKCGHTFCTSCIESLTSNGLKCPMDGQTCDSGQLVVNRAVKEQIYDLMIHCCHGVLCVKEEFLELDEDGCREVIRLGDRDAHESSCGFAKVVCTIGGSACGVMRRQTLEKHLSICSRIPCPYGEFGKWFSSVGIYTCRHFRLLSHPNCSRCVQYEVFVYENKECTRLLLVRAHSLCM